MADAIAVSGLTKTYGTFTAVDGIDLDVTEGEIFGFLGPNGAGKTTTIEILEGFRTRTAGSVQVLGEDPAEAGSDWRQHIGIVLQLSQAPRELSPREAVTMYAAYYEAPRPVEDVLEIVGLREKADDRVRKLSGGQQRRLDLALALVGDPKLIFLDEPTTGFDPSARRESWTMIDNLRSLGCTVLLTTHYMDEAQTLADRIGVIAAGRIVATGTAAELADQVRVPPTISWLGDRAPDGLGDATAVERSDGRVTLTVDEPDLIGMLHQVTGWAADAGIELAEFSLNRPTLEDTYLALVGDAAATTDAETAPATSSRRGRSRR